MQLNTHRTWAEIDLGAIEHNFKQIKKYVGDYPIMAIIKADAYGHGSFRVAQSLAKAGASYFAVATVSEAIELREQGVTLPIMILGYVGDEDAYLISRYDITVPVYDYETAKVFSQAAKQAGKPIKIHFALDTGMTRIGFPARHVKQTVKEILKLSKLSGIVVEGIFTHFSVADTLDGAEFTNMQIDEFNAVVLELEQAGLHIPFKHCTNSGGVLQYKSGYYDMVRAGIILYGYYPDTSLPKNLNLKPAMRLKARVVQVRKLEEGRFISYGKTFKTTKPINEAVISIGYADGYLRSGSGNVQMSVNGKKANVLGRICMDMCMIEVPDGVCLSRGDEVTIFGDDVISADDVANASGTISYEVLCAISSRVPRIYING